MPSEINPALVPAITPGNIFQEFTTDDTLNVRWLTQSDPVLFEALNRPLFDIVLRQLIIAKALDAIELSLSHQALFPFLIPCLVQAGSGNINLPTAWLWDMHVSLPAKWEYLRLAKIKRISGSNGAGSNPTVTGRLRLVFSAQVEGSGVEVSLFEVDYLIESTLTYQINRITAVTATEESNPIPPAEATTIDGFITFRTLPLTDSNNVSFIQHLAPPLDTTANPDGTFINPAIYETVATPTGNGNFLAAALSHGSGVVVSSAWNAIPALDSDFASWLQSSNYPFRIGSTRISIEGIVIPQALFNEFNMVVPAPEEATSDSTNNNSPVWLSNIVRVDSLATTLQFIFSTNQIQDDGSTILPVQFASLTLQRSMIPGVVVNILPINDLLNNQTTEESLFRQGFGLGHVVLGSLWGSTTDAISQFFDSFLQLISTDQATFTKDSGRISSFALARSSRYIPTQGEWDALKGSTARLTSPKTPSDSNRYVTEADQGLGDTVDFRARTGFSQHPDIEDIAYTGGLSHRAVWLIINSSDSPNLDYNRDILPRLRCLFSRDPQFGDFWWDGTVLKFYKGDAWVSL